MRVIIILAAVAFTHGAKLERTSLPPSNARTAGGSGNFLQTPLSVSGIPGSASNFPTRNSYQNAQSGSDLYQSGNGFAQSGNEYAQSGNDYAQSGNDYVQSGAQYDGVNFNNFATEARPERPRAAFERNAAILRQDSSNDGDTFSYAYETENGIYAEESGVATNGVEAQGGYSYTGDDGQVYSIRYTADQNGFVAQGDHLPTPPPIPEEILKALDQNARDEAAGIYDDGSYNDGKYGAASNNNYNGQFNYQQNNAFNGNNDDTVVTNSALARSGNAPAYNAPTNDPAYNAPIVANTGIAPTYGIPNAETTPTFNTANSRNIPSFNGPISNVPSLNAPSAGIPRNSAVEKAYLPPLADQGQASNAFGRRQQSFNARTGYQY